MIDSGQVLEEDLKWREAELASLKILVLESAQGTIRQKVLLRALCALLYAHYEGFCKYAWDYYFDSLEKTGVLRQDCVEKIAKASLQKDFKEIRGNLSLSAMWELCTTTFQSLMQQNLAFAVKVETNSNLWPNLLIENSSSLGLSCSVAQDHAIKLKSLVARRNNIAHGQKTTISSLGEYQAYENAAIIVMHELAVSVLESLESKAYLLTQTKGTTS